MNIFSVKPKKKKRETFLSLLIKALCVSLILSLLFARGFKKYLFDAVTAQAEESVDGNLSKLQQLIGEIDANTDTNLRMQEIGIKLGVYANPYVVIEDSLSMYTGEAVMIYPGYSENSHAAVALVDENGNIAASSRRKLSTVIRFGENDDHDDGFYVCDNEKLNMPEIDRLYEDYRELSEKQRAAGFAQIDIDSVYVDRKTHTFIPHHGTIKLYDTGNRNEYLTLISPGKEIDSRDINITITAPDYEFLENISAISDYPKKFATAFSGEDRDIIERFDFEFLPDPEKLKNIYRDKSESIRSFTKAVRIYVDKKPYELYLSFVVNYDDPTIIKMYRKWVIIFSAAVTIFSLLYIWHKNDVNKANYAFEDYRRDLTNHLAHDLKTPLMAIGGYAENIMEGGLSDEENRRYLNSIMENVGFMDSLISRTLFLNRTDDKKLLNTEKIQVKNVVESAVAKYAPLLDEKKITFTSDGDAEIAADRTALETIIENLISNAVKYTPVSGMIEASLSEKHLIFTNTVSGKVDIGKIDRPYERGDASRSNTAGSGLGLSIARRAADLNGFSLRISCSDTAFRAELLTAKK